MKTFFLSLIAAVASAGEVLPYLPVQVTVDGQPRTLYIGTPDSYWFTGGGGDEVVIPQNGRAYLVEKDNIDDPNNYFRPNLLGGYMEFDTNLTHSECGCVLAMYMVSMPARNSDGSYNSGEKGQYYCDANEVGGTFCPEYDIIETNQRAFQTTNHNCDEPNEFGYYSNCDRAGAGYQNSSEQLGDNDWCPSDSCTINTLNDIHVRHEWQQNESGDFAAFKITVSQGDKSVSMLSNLPSAYAKATKTLNDGMVFTMSSYYGGEPWLSKGKCPSGVSCQLQDVSFRNMVFSSTGAELAPPAPDPTSYEYGDACDSNYNDYCDGCAECDFSWPKDDPAKWDSDDAACRCKPVSLDAFSDSIFNISDVLSQFTQ